MQYFTLKFVKEYQLKEFAIAKTLITSNAAVPDYLEVAVMHSPIETFIETFKTSQEMVVVGLSL